MDTSGGYFDGSAPFSGNFTGESFIMSASEIAADTATQHRIAAQRIMECFFMVFPFPQLSGTLNDQLSAWILIARRPWCKRWTVPADDLLAAFFGLFLYTSGILAIANAILPPF